MSAAIDTRVVGYTNKSHLTDDIRLGALMDDIQGEDHKRLALIVDLRVGALERAVERVADSVSDIKGSVGELRGMIITDRDNRKEISDRLDEVSSKLEVHMSGTDSLSTANTAKTGGTQKGWENPTWLASLTGLFAVGAVLVLLLGRDIVKSIVDWWIGG